MKKSPFVRIREKNQEIKDLKQHLQDIASLLECHPNITEILSSIIEAQEWRGKMTDALLENDQLRVNMGTLVADQVERTTFDSQLKSQKLQLEVDRLNKIIDTKDNDIQKYQSKLSGNQKGFWDFIYKVFKIN